MKILITGAGGQLARAAEDVLAHHDLVPVPHSRLDIGNPAAVQRVVNAEGPDVVLNAAAFNDVDGAESDRDAVFRANAAGPRNLAEATASLGIPLLHVSTDYVFDGAGRRPYHEFDRPDPRSAYGASKLAGEEAVRQLNPRHYIVRTAWLFHVAGRNFCKTMLGLAGRPAVRVVSDQFGSPTYAPHLAAALGELLETGAYGTYHMAGSGGTSWYELTCELYRCLGIRTPVHPASRAEFARPAERPVYSVLTTAQSPAITLPPWQEGVAAFAAALRDEEQAAERRTAHAHREAPDERPAL